MILKAGKRDGFGQQVFSNGDMYAGGLHFAQSVYGMIVLVSFFARDCLYICKCSKLLQSRVLAGWKDGVMHDRGVYHFANGDYLEGVWQEAALITWWFLWMAVPRTPNAREDIMELPTSMVLMGLWAEGSAPGEVCNEWRKLLLRHFETRCKPSLGKKSTHVSCIIWSYANLWILEGWLEPTCKQGIHWIHCPSMFNNLDCSSSGLWEWSVA